MPALVRSHFPDATIGFFLHVPFPNSEIFRTLHGMSTTINSLVYLLATSSLVRTELLHGMLGADLIGFQVIYIIMDASDLY